MRQVEGQHVQFEVVEGVAVELLELVEGEIDVLYVVEVLEGEFA